MIYFRGTVGKICLIADAKSVKITSALCEKQKDETKRKSEKFKGKEINSIFHLKATKIMKSKP